MWHIANIFLLCAVFVKGSQGSDEDLAPIISVSSGKVKGLTLKSDNGNDYFAYRAIPYGKSTAEHKRFKPPEPVDAWAGIFNATEFGPECPQFNIITRGVEGTEDCLVLNVYTPKIPDASLKSNLPVLVFLHGGAFNYGTGSYPFYGPDRFMDHNVILVTINYRLGVLGFLSTEDEVSPGNYGMLDQVLALRWVKKNIGKFGGNTEKITIFGESAGSASVIYHLLSPLSKGLFHRAIAQSGSVLNHWANQKHPLEYAKAVAGIVDCPTDSTKKLVDCFREMSLYDLIRKPFDLQISTFFPMFHSPVIEKPGRNGFMIEDPLLLLREGRLSNKVPLIIGLNELEMLTFYPDLINEFLMKFYIYDGQKHLDKDFPKILPSLFNTEFYNDSDLIQLIKKEYFKNSDISDRTKFKNTLSKLMTDAGFGVGIAETAKLIAKAGIPTWTYVYKHLGQHGLSELFGVAPGNYAAHADELFIQFPFFFAQLVKLNKEDKRMAFIMNSLWSKFANGDDLLLEFDGQSVRWDLYDPKNPNYLELTVRPQMKNGKMCDKLEFWSEILPKVALKNSSKSKNEI